jgi:putative endonuclease
MEKCFWVYIVTDKPYGTLYTGFSSDLSRRTYEHRQGLYEGFSKKYGLKKLVYYEEYPTALDAIAREKKLKGWKREWKINLIKSFNPEWQDLYESFNQ